jgi:hypothetical protein
MALPAATPHVEHGIVFLESQAADCSFPIRLKRSKRWIVDLGASSILVQRISGICKFAHRWSITA